VSGLRAVAQSESLTRSFRGYDTIFLVDDSGSMAGALWNEAGKALAGVARVASQYDDDGIDIYFLNSRDFARKVTVSRTSSPQHSCSPFLSTLSCVERGNSSRALYSGSASRVYTHRRPSRRTPPIVPLLYRTCPTRTQ
jgi:hypothetical protein